MQQDNNPSTQVIRPKNGKEEQVNVLEWLSQSSDLNPIKMLWKDLSKFIGGKYRKF